MNLTLLGRYEPPSRFLIRFALVVAAVTIAALILSATGAHAATPQLCGPWHFWGHCYGPPIGGQG